MPCSSFEPLLDALLDGALPPARAARVAAHAESCVRCGSLLAELRAIDGLLMQPRVLEPAANFTFAVMAEARAMPPPHVQRMPHLAVLGTYVVFGWVAIAAFFVFGGAAAHATIAFVTSSAVQFGNASLQLSSVVGRAFGRGSFGVTAAMGAAIAIDLLGVALLAAVYARRRTRRTTLGTSE